MCVCVCVCVYIYIYMRARARSSNYSRNEHAIMRSLCILIAGLRVPRQHCKTVRGCHGNAQLRSFYTAVMLQNISYCYQQYVNVFIYSATLLSDINPIWGFLDRLPFKWSPRLHIPRIYVQWHIRTDGQNEAHGRFSPLKSKRLKTATKWHTYYRYTVTPRLTSAPANEFFG